MATTCPRCATPTDGRAECAQCGIVFARHNSGPRPQPRRASPSPEAPITVWELLVRSYKVLRWAVLAVLLVALFLILRPDTAPTIETGGEASQRLEAKLVDLHRQVAGASRQLRLDEAELNTWMQSNLALASSPAAAPPPERPGSMPIPPPATIEEVQSNVRDVRVQIDGDRILGYVLFDIRGKELSLTLEGKLRVQGGYLRLDADAMKLGSLPIPRATVERAVARLFDSPENREQFRVPDSVRDIRVDNGDLVVDFR